MLPLLTAYLLLFSRYSTPIKTLNFTTKHGLALSCTVLPPSELAGQWGGAGQYVGARHEDTAGGRTQSDTQPWSPLNVGNQGSGLLCSLLHIINMQAGVEPAGSFCWKGWPVWPRGSAAGSGQYCGHLVTLRTHLSKSIRIIYLFTYHIICSKNHDVGGRVWMSYRKSIVWR